MKVIPLLLLVGMFAVSGWAEEEKPEPYSPELVKRAEAGDAKAQVSLGLCCTYGYGKGATIDSKEAVKWWTKAAEQGDARGQYRLGFCYYAGTGVTQDDKEAVKWYTKAAQQGNADAQFQLGVC